MAQEDWHKIYTRVPTELNARLLAYQKQQPEQPSIADVAARALARGLAVMEAEETPTEPTDVRPWVTCTLGFTVQCDLKHGFRARGKLSGSRLVDASGKPVTGEIQQAAWVFDHAAANVRWRVPSSEATVAAASILKHQLGVAIACGSAGFRTVVPVGTISPRSEDPFSIHVADGPQVWLESCWGSEKLEEPLPDDGICIVPGLPAQPTVTGILTFLVRQAPPSKASGENG